MMLGLEVLGPGSDVYGSSYEGEYSIVRESRLEWGKSLFTKGRSGGATRRG